MSVNEHRRGSEDRGRYKSLTESDLILFVL